MFRNWRGGMHFINDYQGLLTVVLLGCVIALLLRRRPSAEPKQNEELARIGEQLRTAEKQRETLRRELETERITRGQLETTRDALNARISEQAEQIEALNERQNDLQRDLGLLKSTESRLTAERDALSAEGERLKSEKSALDDKLQAEIATVKERDRQIGALNGTMQELKATLTAERERHVQLREETAKNREDFVAQFKAISGEILQTQGRATTEAQKTELEKIITPFKVEIEGV